MPHARLPLPDYPWTSAFRALVEVLKEDPDLRRVVKAWRCWEGGPEDMEPLEPAQLPWVLMTPAPSGIKRATDADYQTDFRVNFTFGVPGTRVDDLMNLWGAVMQALRFDRPFRDRTVGEHFRDRGAIVHGVVGVGVDPKVTGDGDTLSDAVVTMLLFVPA